MVDTAHMSVLIVTQKEDVYIYIVRQFIIEDIKTYFQIEVCIFLPWQGSGTNRRKASR